MEFRDQTIGEEIMNGITHGLGALLALIGTGGLVWWGISHNNKSEIIAFGIYGASLFFLYLMSTLYHSIQHQKAKQVLRILDHTSIFVLIAGTYTPFALVTLHGTLLGWIVLTLVWSLAVAGIVLKAFFIDRIETLSLITYLAMGWLVLLFLQPVARGIGPSGMAYLLAGGLFYSFGVYFYRFKRFKFYHGVWHLFVLAGSMAHFWVILQYVKS
jgi:hemolysin III